MNEAFSVDGAFNRRDIHAAEIPAANGVTNARTLAPNMVMPNGEPDTCLIMPTTFDMGFMTYGLCTYGLCDESDGYELGK